MTGPTPRLDIGYNVAGAPLSSVADSVPLRVAAVLDTVACLFAGDIVSGFSSFDKVRLDQLSAVLPNVAPGDPLRKVLVPVKGEVLQVNICFF